MQHTSSIALALTLLSAGCTADPCVEPGTICTIAGMPGELGFNGDGLDRLETMLYFPSGLAYDPDGRLVVNDFNNMRIRRLEADGRLVTIVGNGAHGWATDGAPALESALENPIDVVYGAEGTLFIAEVHTSRVLSVADDVVRVYAGNGDDGLSGDGGPAVDATFREPAGLAVDDAGALYIADTTNHSVRVVHADGSVHRVVGDGVPGWSDEHSNPRLTRPQRVAVDGDRLLISDTGNHAIRALDLVTGEVQTLIGTGVAASDGDGGPAVDASINEPYGVITAPDGTIYIAEVGGHRVRAIDPTGVVRTVAGTGVAGHEGDEGPATEAQLRGPADMLLAPDGGLLIADMLNGSVRRIAP
jgi:sugar lactone lactonase YvrE